MEVGGWLLEDSGYLVCSAHQLVCSADISEDCNASMYRVILIPQLVLICIQLATFICI